MGLFANHRFLQHSATTASQWQGEDDACLCSQCFIKLSGLKPTQPKYSIAAGLDFGDPEGAELPKLSLLERKLISRNRIFFNYSKTNCIWGVMKEQSNEHCKAMSVSFLTRVLKFWLLKHYHDCTTLHIHC